MRIDLYPADDESTNPREDFLDLLRKNDSAPLEVVPLQSPSRQIRGMGTRLDDEKSTTETGSAPVSMSVLFSGGNSGNAKIRH